MRPQSIVRTFKVADAKVPYSMIIVYEGEPGAQEVRSAEITLNGTVVAAPNTFAEHKHVVTIPVTLASSSTLGIDIRGPRGSHMVIRIGPQ
jgi:hypothetical protein